MRWNRGTIVLIAALLVVIVVVLVINNNQASAPGETPTPEVNSGVLLPVTDVSTIARYEMRDNSTGDFAALTKDSGGAWHIDATNALPTRDPDQSLIDSTAGKIVGLKFSNSFTNDQLATFGLDAPSYTLLITTNDGNLYTLYVGNKTPTSPSYYTVLLNTTAPSATEDTSAAIATENVNSADANTLGGESLDAITPEATAQVSAATAEAAATISPEATAEATEPVRIENPQITLTGSQIIYVIPQTVIDTLTKWLQTPPYAPLPTATPTVIVTLDMPTETPVAP